MPFGPPPDPATLMQTGSPKVYGQGSIPVGLEEPLPLRGFPAGRVRIRQRVGSFARVFVCTAEGVRVWVPRKVDGHWVPYAEQGRNTTMPERSRS